MSQHSDEQSVASPQVAGDTLLDSAFRVGRFWYYADDDRWEWSDQLAQLHGYKLAADVVITTELLLGHKHPDDKARVAELIERVRRAGECFSSQHRIIDVLGNVIPVMVVADLMLDAETGRRLGSSGFYVAAATAALATTAGTGEPTAIAEGDTPFDIDDAMRRRSVIERAKGALMLVYRLDEQQAFDLLVWRSQESNTKLHAVAAAIVARFADVDVPSRTRASFDRVLLTAHEDAGD